jgi:hypothetical protein
MFERPNQNQERTITPEIMAEQIALPQEEWSDEFKQYIAEETQKELKRRNEETPEKTIEEERKATFERYLRGLAISPDELKGKVVMDIGSGDGEFVEELVDRGITQEAYGIDVRDPYEVEKYAKHFFKDSFEKPLPVKDADYAFSVGAISNFAMYAETEDALKQVLKNALASIKEAGEVRIYPIHRPPYDSSELEGMKESYERWQDVIQKFASEENVEWELNPIDIRIDGKDLDNVWLMEMLKVKKRKAQQP